MENASSCKFVQVASLYKLLQVCASFCKLVQVVASLCKFVQVRASLCKLQAQVCASLCKVQLRSRSTFVARIVAALQPGCKEMEKE